MGSEGEELKKIDRKSAIFFANQLRTARLAALADAEAFDEIIYAVERLGSYLTGKQQALGRYRAALELLARESSLAEDTPKKFRASLTPFSELFESVRIARNDALHQGAFARHLAKHTIELAIVLEEALRQYLESYVTDFMTRNPVCAELWQPVSFIRQQMLANSFSYLPVLEGGDPWRVVSDVAIARFLGSGGDESRDSRLAKTLQEACKKVPYVLKAAKIVEETTTLRAALDHFGTEHVLLVREQKSGGLLGILTAFDLL